MWVDKESGTVYPTAPGTIIGKFDETLLESSDSRQLMNFKRLFEKVQTEFDYSILYKDFFTNLMHDALDSIETKSPLIHTKDNYYSFSFEQEYLLAWLQHLP